MNQLYVIMLIKAILGGRYMKRLIAAALVLSLCLTAMTGCSSKETEIKDSTAVQTGVLDEFYKILKIPRESDHENAISTYLRSWAKENGYKVVRDNYHNVIINVPATAGYENAPTTILQTNMDTRIAIDENTIFDPFTNPIAINDDGDTLTATGTSIGASSGIGMATALYVLKNSAQHGPLRVIFTADGENGMSGAANLKSKHLEGDYLINLNGNSDKTIGLGSGGTAAYDMIHEIQWTAPQNALPYILSISGLNGGNANEDISDGGANAIKTIGEVLANAQGTGILFELGGFNGGISRDTIPTAATALVIINESDQRKMQKLVDDSMNAFKDAYGDVEKHYSFTFEPVAMPDKVVSFDDNGSIISFIYGIINGVQSRSETYDVIESASNLGMVSTATGNFLAQVSAGSTSDVGLYEITSAHEAISSMCSLNYTYIDGIPRWPDHPDSVLCTNIRAIWSSLFGDELEPGIIHKASECGWFAKKNPKLQIVSIGPMIVNANLPNEAIVKKTVSKPADVVMAFLEQTKVKQ